MSHVVDIDRSMDSLNFVENRIIALISSLIDFNPGYFDDADNLSKLHKLTNMLDSNERVVFNSSFFFLSFFNFIFTR